MRRWVGLQERARRLQQLPITRMRREWLAASSGLIESLLWDVAASSWSAYAEECGANSQSATMAVVEHLSILGPVTREGFSIPGIGDRGVLGTMCAVRDADRTPRSYPNGARATLGLLQGRAVRGGSSGGSGGRDRLGFGFQA